MAAHSAPPREPGLTRAGVVTAISGLSAALVWLHGGVYSTWLDEHKDALAGALLLVGPTISAWLARRHTTPLADPRDADGAPLVAAPPVVDTTAEVAAVLAAANQIHPAT